MSLAEIHPEDVKAALRKRFLTIRQFEIDHDLPKGSVHDVLRNRRSARVEAAIAQAIGVSANQSENSDSTGRGFAHGQNSEAA